MLQQLLGITFTGLVLPIDAAQSLHRSSLFLLPLRLFLHFDHAGPRCYTPLLPTGLYTSALAWQPASLLSTSLSLSLSLSFLLAGYKRRLYPLRRRILRSTQDHCPLILWSFDSCGPTASSEDAFEMTTNSRALPRTWHVLRNSLVPIVLYTADNGTIGISSTFKSTNRTCSSFDSLLTYL